MDHAAIGLLGHLRGRPEIGGPFWPQRTLRGRSRTICVVRLRSPRRSTYTSTTRPWTSRLPSNRPNPGGSAFQSEPGRHERDQGTHLPDPL